jgi:ABC-type glutathione transport system ATPase component
VRSADQILVLENGTIVERGNHDQLMALGGRYAAMIEREQRRESTQADIEEAFDEEDREPVVAGPATTNRTGDVQRNGR